MTRLRLPAIDRTQSRRGRRKTSLVPVARANAPTNRKTRKARQTATVCQLHRPQAAWARADMTANAPHPASIQRYGRTERCGTSAGPRGKGIMYGGWVSGRAAGRKPAGDVAERLTHPPRAY